MSTRKLGSSFLAHALKPNSEILHKLLTSTIVTNNIETATNTLKNTDNADDYSKRRNNRPLRITDETKSFWLLPDTNTLDNVYTYTTLTNSKTQPIAEHT